MRRSILTVSFIATAGVLGACTGAAEVKPVAPNNASGTPATASGTPAAASSPAVNPSVSPTVDPKAAAAPSAKAVALEGKWTGAEGTHLNVIKKGDKYAVEIKNLDKTETFDGFAKGDTIQFKRADKLETITAATGDETGMKWLAGEKNCVVITKGSEGYCRK
jgi:hypothetical protein